MVELLSARTLAGLDVAARARTIVASATDVEVEVAGVATSVPYVDLDGAPLLVVPAGMVPLLLAERPACLRLGPAAGASVVVSGHLVAVSHDLLEGAARAAVAAASRRGAAKDGRTALLQLVVDAVVIQDAADAVSLDVAGYWGARPHEVLARGWQLARHLNGQHAADLRLLAARVLRSDASRVLAAEIIGIDPEGLELQVVDVDGGWRSRFVFGQACTTLREVGEAIVAGLSAEATSPRR